MTFPGAAAVLEEPRTAQPAEPFLAWPGWDHIGYTLLLSLPNTLWFMLVYGGADFLTAHRHFRVRVHFAAELHVPFLPAMTVFYMSVYLLFFAGPFILRRRREVRALVGTLALMILFAGIGFLLFPSELAFVPPAETELGVWAGLFHLADKMNLTYNLAPSLHVALAVACITVYASRASATGKVLLWLWAAMIAGSTILTHQHHVVDAVTGWLLAVFCVEAFFPRLCAVRS
ncbi:MAG TPA: phosphatase PAP2 family protein [Candidatus Angelobacter sp.]